MPSECQIKPGKTSDMIWVQTADDTSIGKELNMQTKLSNDTSTNACASGGGSFETVVTPAGLPEPSLVVAISSTIS